LNNLDINKYKEAADKFLPEKIKVLFIAESPPANGSFLYFKFPKQEILLATITTAIFGDGKGYKRNDSKIGFLNILKDEGYFLIDAVEYPINTIDDRKRELIIQKEMENLIDSLKDLKSRNKIDSYTKIILIKKSVFNVLNNNLKQKGYNILNKVKVDFPKYYNDRDTIREVRNLLEINY
jgi:hypothetical protein